MSLVEFGVQEVMIIGKVNELCSEKKLFGNTVFKTLYTVPWINREDRTRGILD